MKQVQPLDELSFSLKNNANQPKLETNININSSTNLKQNVTHMTQIQQQSENIVDIQDVYDYRGRFAHRENNLCYTEPFAYRKINCQQTKVNNVLQNYQSNISSSSRQNSFIGLDTPLTHNRISATKVSTNLDHSSRSKLQTKPTTKNKQNQTNPSIKARTKTKNKLIKNNFNVNSNSNQTMLDKFQAEQQLLNIVDQRNKEYIEIKRQLTNLSTSKEILGKIGDSTWQTPTNANSHLSFNKRFKTSENNYPLSTTNRDKQKQKDKQKNNQQFLKLFYNTSQQFIKTHKPFLQNKRIVFNIKSKNRTNFINHINSERDNQHISHTTNLENLQIPERPSNYYTHAYKQNSFAKDQNQKQVQCAPKQIKQNNIQRLKKEIIQLDKQDFVSYRSKCYSNVDQVKIINNEKISKYNYQNSMIVEWKGKIFNKLNRPSSTIGVSPCQSPFSNFIGFSSHSSAPKKYFSKPKGKGVHTKDGSNPNPNNTEVHGSNLLNNAKMKLKTEEIAIGLNMFRGKIHRKKVNSSFQIHC